MTAAYTLNYGTEPITLTGIGKVRVKDSHLWLSDGSGELVAVLPLHRLETMWRTDIAADEADDAVMLVFRDHKVLQTPVEPVARVSGVTKVDVYTDPGNYNRTVLTLESDDDDLPAGVLGSYYAVRRESLVP